MAFEFDARKSTTNKRKHGIDFVDAQALWTAPDRLKTPARSVDEERLQVIGQIDQTIWSAFVTHRGPHVRIISVRRARPEEETRYYGD